MHVRPSLSLHSLQNASTDVILLPLKKKKEKKKLDQVFILYARKLEPKEVINPKVTNPAIWSWDF